MSTSVPTTAAHPFQESPSSKKDTPPDSQQPQDPQLLELAIFTPFVAQYTEPPPAITTDTLAESTMSTTEPSNEPGIARLLSGPLADFELYSGQERSQWLLEIAHDICDPLQKRGSLIVWNEWGYRGVTPADTLIPSLYVYLLPPSAVVALTKISARTGRTRTSTSGNGSTMARRVYTRDGGQCWVSRDAYNCKNSHAIPRRMGDHLLRRIYETFVGTPPHPALSVYDEICGILLNPFLDTLFDVYELGLRFVAPVRSPSLLVFYS